MEFKMFTKNLEDGLKVTSRVFHVTYEDKLYHALNIINMNRDIKPSKVNKLMKSISDNNALHLRPILVDTDYNIIDGQTRYKAAKALGLPIEIHLIDKSNWNYKDLITINTTQVNWNPKDYLIHYMKQGLLKYEIFNSLLTTNKVTIQVLVAIYHEVYARNNINMNKFKAGKLPEGALNNGHVRDTLHMLSRVQNTPVFPLLTEVTKKNQEFQLVLMKNFQTKGFNLESFLSKLETYPHNFNKIRGKLSFETEVENIIFDI